MKLLDLFCGAGGCAVGYHRAGFAEIVGVDIEPQPRYPFEFVQADALEFVAQYGKEFDVIHASPPCQAYSVTISLTKIDHPDLVELIRKLLKATGKPYIIENVPGAPLVNPIKLCGTMFTGLKVIRHRLFETRPVIWWPPAPCQHVGGTTPRGAMQRFRTGEYLTVAGESFLVAEASIAMGIDWMTGPELSQAIPPAYTEWLGRQILEAIR